MSNAKRDENNTPAGTGVSSVDGSTIVPLHVDPVTDYLLVDLSLDTITCTPFYRAKIDENDSHTALGVSSSDGTTILPLRTDNNGTLLVQLT